MPELDTDAAEEMTASGYWTLEQACEYLDLDPTNRAAHQQLARWGIEKQTVVRAEDVIAQFPQPRTKQRRVRTGEGD